MTNTNRPKSNQQQHWQQHVNDWHNSGLSGPKFCQDRGLVYHQFTYWRKKLTANTEQPSAGGFTQVVQRQSFPDGLTVLLPNGAQIQGITTTNLTLVHQLLEQL